MENLTNEQLLTELKKRFDQNSEMMREQSKLVKQLEKINQRLIQSEQIQSRFLSNIRNEINNPLTAILGMSRELMAGNADLEKLQKNAYLIFSESFLLGLQLQNIFVAAELEAGQSRPYIMNVKIVNLIESTLENFKHLTNRKKLSVKISADLKEDSFRSDPEKLKVILSNLLMNAVEYTPQSGNISISIVRQRDGQLSISVQDSGEGIAEEKLGTIFDRFVQLNSGSTKIHPGHGLGLSVVSSLVELLGGKIEVVSQPKKGSAFLITLPESTEMIELNGLSADGNEFMFESDDEVTL